MSRPVGWRREPARHSLAAKGVKTSRQSPVPPAHVGPEYNKRAVVQGIARLYNTDIDTARRIYDWIKEHRPEHLYEEHHVGADYSYRIPREKDIQDACDALGIPRYEYKLIAGRGKGMQLNWGVDAKGQPPQLIDRWEKELKKHVGETVFLSGGGGAGVSAVKLRGVHKEVWNRETGRMGLRAELERLEDRPLHYKKGEIFDPWIDSWQISVLEKVN